MTHKQEVFCAIIVTIVLYMLGSLEYWTSPQGQAEAEVIKARDAALPEAEHTPNQAASRYLLGPDEGEFRNREDVQVWLGVNRLVEEVGNIVSQEFKNFVKEHALADAGLQAGLEGFIELLRLDEPRFRLMYGEEALAWIYEQGFQEETDSREKTLSMYVGKYDCSIGELRVLVFQLPEFSARFWDQSVSAPNETRSGYSEERVSQFATWEQAMPWGDFYRQIMPIIWGKLDHVGTATKYRIGLDRINNSRQHDKFKYYYAWIVFTARMETLRRERLTRLFVMNEEEEELVSKRVWDNKMGGT